MTCSHDWSNPDSTPSVSQFGIQTIKKYRKDIKKKREKNQINKCNPHKTSKCLLLSTRRNYQPLLEKWSRTPPSESGWGRIKVQTLGKSKNSRLFVHLSNIVGLWKLSYVTFSDWSRGFAPNSQPIRFKTKANRDLVTRVFPRYLHSTRFLLRLLIGSSWLFWLAVVIARVLYRTQTHFVTSHTYNALRMLLARLQLSPVPSGSTLSAVTSPSSITITYLFDRTFPRNGLASSSISTAYSNWRDEGNKTRYV